MPKRSTKSAKRATPHPETIAGAGARTFRATLEPDHTSLKWTVARIPFDASAAWPHMLRRRVAGTINGVPFRTSLFPAGNAGVQILLINKRMQAAAHAHLSDQADLTSGPTSRTAQPNSRPSLLSAFDGDKSLHLWTFQLSDSMRREIGKAETLARPPRHRRF